MAGAVGAFIRKVEGSGRMTLPEQLADDLSKNLILAPGFDNCIRVYGKKQWEAWEKKLADLDPDDPDEGDLIRFYRAMSSETKVDDQKRLRFTDVLLKWAGIDEEHREIQLYDNGEFLEVWEVGRWTSFMTEKAPVFKELARKVFGKRRNDGEQSDESGASAGDGG